MDYQVNVNVNTSGAEQAVKQLEQSLQAISKQGTYSANIDLKFNGKQGLKELQDFASSFEKISGNFEKVNKQLSSKSSITKELKEAIKQQQDMSKISNSLLSQSQRVSMNSKIDMVKNMTGLTDADVAKMVSLKDQALNVIKELEEAQSKGVAVNQGSDAYKAAETKMADIRGQFEAQFKAAQDAQKKFKQIQKDTAKLTESLYSSNTRRRNQNKLDMFEDAKDSVKNIEAYEKELANARRLMSELDDLKQKATTDQKLVGASKDSDAYIKHARDIDKANRELAQSFKNLQSMQGPSKFIGQITQGFGQLVASMFTFQRMIGMIKDAVNSVKQINDDMVTISMTMDVSEQQLDGLKKSTIENAKTMGTTIQDAMDVSKIYANMKTTPGQIIQLSMPTIELANASGLSTSEVSGYIQAVLNQFSMSEDQAEHIADVYENISANIKLDFAEGIQDIAQGVQVAGQLVEASGMSFEKFAAIVGKTAETTRQHGSQIGNQWKTILTRISRASGVTDEEIDPETLSKASEALAKVGIQVYDTAGNFNSVDDILGSLAEKWDGLSDAMQSEIAFALAATRNSNTLRVALKSYAEATDLATKATNETGVAQRNQEKYMESYTAKINRGKAEIEDLQETLLDSGFTKGIIDTFGGILGLVNSFASSGEVAKIITSGGIIGGILGLTGKLNIPGIGQISKGITGLLKTSLDIPIEQGLLKGFATSFARDLPEVIATFGEEGISAGFTMLSSSPVLMASAVGLAIATAGALGKAWYETQDAFTEASEKAVTTAEDYSKTQTTLNQLNSELETTQSRMAELSALPRLTLVEETEYAALSKQNDELERQIALQKSLADIQRDAAITAATTAATTEKSIMEQAQDKHGKFWGTILGFLGGGAHVNDDGTIGADFESATIPDLAKQNIKKLQKAQNDLRNIERELIDDPENKAFLKAQEEYRNTIAEATKDLADQSNTMGQWITSMTDESGLPLENLTAEQRSVLENLQDTVKLISDIGKTEPEKALSSLDDFFDRSTGKNRIKDKLIEAREAGKSLSDALRSMGLTIDDLGVSNLHYLYQYLDDARASAESATDAVEQLATSVSDVEAATSSENQDKNWTTIQAAFKSGQELLKSGKTGTDDFQTLASFFAPDREALQKLAEQYKEAGGYAANAYQEAFEQAQKTLGGWFGEDEDASMLKFVDDMASKGLFKTSTNDKGLVEIETQFKNTTEAAEKFGVSVEAIDVMLDGLEAYGYDFSGILRADDLDGFKSALDGIKDVADSLEDTEAKNFFGNILSQYKGEEDKLLEDLSKEQIVQIKFQYDLAQLREELDEQVKNARRLGGSDVGASVSALGTAEAYRDQLADMFGGSDVVGKHIPIYFDYQEQLNELEEQLAQTTEPDEKVKILMDMENLTEQQAEIMESFLAMHPEITPDIAPEEAEKALKQWVKSEEADIPDGIKVPINAEDHATEVMDEVEATEVKGKTVAVDVEGNAPEKLDEVKEKTDAINSNPFFEIGVNDNASETIDAVKEKTDSLDKNPLLQLGAKDNASSTIDGVIKKEKSIERNPLIHINVQDSASGVISSVITKLDQLNGKVANTYIRTKTTNTQQTQLNGTAHASGTYNGKLKNSWITKSDDVALTGELGPEMVVDAKTNTWHTVGDAGAEFAHIPAGSVVFNAKQTEDLLTKGYTNSRGKAKLSGTAYLLKRTTTGGGTTKKTTSGGNTGSGSSGSSGSGSNNNSSSNDFKETFDWIKVLLDRTNRFTQLAIDNIDRAIGLQKKQAKTATALSKTQKEITVNEKAARAYLREANAVGLSAKYRKRVQNGTLDIQTIKNEKLATKIKDYQSYYENYLSAADNVKKLKDQERELSQRRLENIQNEYEALIKINEASRDWKKSLQDLYTAQGKNVNGSNMRSSIKGQIDQQQIVVSKAQKQLVEYEKEFARLQKKGYYKKHSEEYREALATISDFKTQLNNAKVELIELQDALKEASRTEMEYLINRYERQYAKRGAQMSLMEARDETVGEDMYTAQIKTNNNDLQKQYELRQSLIDQRIAYGKSSDKYEEFSKRIAEADQEIYKLLEDNEKLKDSIYAFRMKPLEDAIDTLDKAKKEADTFLGLLNEDAYFDKEGNATIEATTAIMLYSDQIKNCQQEIAEYRVGLDKLQDMLDNGVISQEEFTKASEEYKNGILDNVKVIQNYKKTLSDLYLKHMKAENDALAKTIKLRKEALKRKADYYDYDKKIRSLTKDRDELEAQARALEGVNNAAAQAELKRLQAQLSEANEALDDAKREHQQSIEEQGYDALLEDANKALEDIEYELTHSSEKQQQIVDEMLNSIVDKYDTAYGHIKEIIHNAMGDATASEGVQNINTSPIPEMNGNSGANRTNSDIERGISSEKVSKPVTSVSVSKKSVSLNIGQKKTVTATVNPKNATDTKVTWKSSNTKVATVSGGTITGKNPGTCTVTVTTRDGNKTATVSVTVTKVYQGEVGKQKTAKSTAKATTGKQVTAKGHASGVRSASGGLSWINEGYGENELLVRKSDGAVLTRLGKGDTVFNHENVERLYSLLNGGFNPGLLPKSIRSTGNVSSNAGGGFVFSMGDIVINDATNPMNVLDVIKKNIKSVAKEVSGEMYRDARKTGLRPAW